MALITAILMLLLYETISLKLYICQTDNMTYLSKLGPFQHIDDILYLIPEFKQFQKIYIWNFSY